MTHLHIGELCLYSFEILIRSLVVVVVFFFLGLELTYGSFFPNIKI